MTNTIENPCFYIMWKSNGGWLLMPIPYPHTCKMYIYPNTCIAYIHTV